MEAFEIGQFITDYTLSDTTTFELPEDYYFDPYFDPYLLWILVFTFEIPEFTYALNDYSLDETVEFAEWNTEEYPYQLTDYPVGTIFTTDEFEEFVQYYIGVWNEPDEDQFYSFATNLWFLKAQDDFLITFPTYKSMSSDAFDFSDVVYQYPADYYKVALSVPTLYFTTESMYESFGDMTWSTTPLDIELFPNFPVVALSTTDVFLDDVVPFTSMALYVTHLHLIDTDLFPSLITSWVLVDTYYVDPVDVITWVLIGVYEDFTVTPPIQQILYYLPMDITDWECAFNGPSVSLDEFELIEDYNLIFSDDMGIPDLYSILDVDDFFGVSTIYTSKWRRIIPVDNFRLNSIEAPYVESFVNWQFIHFNTWFDFDDFSCGDFDSPLCPSMSDDAFEIESEFDLPFAILDTESFEISLEDTLFALYTVDSFYTFDMWITQSSDSFDFDRIGVNAHPVYFDPCELSVPNVIWTYFPYIDVYENEYVNYLQHSADYFTFEVSDIKYRLYIEDDTLDTLINIPDDILTSVTELQVNRNKKLIGFDYQGYGYMRGYTYLDYIVPTETKTLAQWLKMLDSMEFYMVFVEDFGVMEFYDSVLMTIDPIRWKRPQVGLEERDSMILTDYFRDYLHYR